MENDEFKSGVEDFLEQREAQRSKTNNVSGVKLHRICTYCKDRTIYSNAKLYCDNCGKKFIDMVIKNGSGRIINRN